MDKDIESMYRRLISDLEEARTNEERLRILKGIEDLYKKFGTKGVNIDNIDTTNLHQEDKNVVDRIMHGNPFSDLEWEEIINKVYSHGDYGFGDEHGPNAWNQAKLTKKAGFWQRIVKHFRSK